MKCFIIHLPNIKNSLNSARKLKKQLEDFNHKVIMFKGTPGDKAIKIFEQKNIKLLGDFSELEKKEKYFLKSIRPGVKGCFYSHYQCWKQCTTLNEPILIFEDDVVLKKNFFPVEFEDILIVASSHKKKMLHYKKYLENNIDNPPSAEDYSRFSMPGNAGYVIKPHAAEILVNTYKNVYVPADNAINQSLVKIQIHNHMMGKAEPRDPTEGKSSLIKTNFWDNQ